MASNSKQQTASPPQLKKVLKLIGEFKEACPLECAPVLVVLQVLIATFAAAIAVSLVLK